MIMGHNPHTPLLREICNFFQYATVLNYQSIIPIFRLGRSKRMLKGTITRKEGARLNAERQWVRASTIYVTIA